MTSEAEWGAANLKMYHRLMEVEEENDRLNHKASLIAADRDSLLLQFNLLTERYDRLARNDDMLLAQRQAVLDLHVPRFVDPDDGPPEQCRHCLGGWPCQTVKALGVAN